MQDRDIIEIKSGDKWLKLRTMDVRVNPACFRVVWDDGEPVFRDTMDASFNQTKTVFRVNGDEVECWVEASKMPHMKAGFVMFCVVYLTPVHTKSHTPA